MLVSLKSHSPVFTSLQEPPLKRRNPADVAKKQKKKKEHGHFDLVEEQMGLLIPNFLVWTLCYQVSRVY